MAQRFLVPQFISDEDKILGPITVRQFLILVVTAFLSFIIWKLADLALAGILIFIVAGFGIVLAFAKINGQAFHIFLLNFVRNAFRPSLRIWRKEYPKDELQAYINASLPAALQKDEVRHKEMPRGRLSELSLMVNTGGAYNPEEYK